MPAAGLLDGVHREGADRVDRHPSLRVVRDIGCSFHRISYLLADTVTRLPPSALAGGEDDHDPIAWVFPAMTS